MMAYYQAVGNVETYADLVARVEPSSWVPLADDARLMSQERTAIFDQLGTRFEELWNHRRRELRRPDDWQERHEAKTGVLRIVIAERDAIFNELAAKRRWERDNKAFFAIMGAQPPVVTPTKF